jgi:UDPglucose 6-dehydrogenase
MDNACIIGYGMVGKAMAEVFSIEKHFDVVADKSNISLEEASHCKLVFICLPTPVDKDGNYLTQDIKNIIRQIEDFQTGCIYVIRSTVFPGFARALQEEMGINRIVSNPEFLSEATAVEDVKNPPFIVIGGFEGQYREHVRAFYESRIKSATVIETDNTTAEMAKLTLNAYFATKVIFANQADDGCRLVGANYETVKKIVSSHPYGPKNHFDVWFKGKRGVGGHCLPKDSLAFALYAHSDLVKKVIELNEKYIYLKDTDV